MKQKDIAVIILIAGFSAVISFVASDRIFVTPANRQQKVDAVDVINPVFQTPDQKYFNSNSIDPAPTTQAGGSNQTPFGNGGN